MLLHPLTPFAFLIRFLFPQFSLYWSRDTILIPIPKPSWDSPPLKYNVRYSCKPTLSYRFAQSLVVVETRSANRPIKDPLRTPSRRSVFLSEQLFQSPTPTQIYLQLHLYILEVYHFNTSKYSGKFDRPFSIANISGPIPTASSWFLFQLRFAALFFIFPAAI